MLDMTPACLRGEGHGALRVATQGATLFSRFPAYTEIGNEQSLLFTEQELGRLHVGRPSRFETLSS